MSSNPQRFHIKIRQPQQKIRFESHLVASMLESLVMSHLSQQLGATDPWQRGLTITRFNPVGTIAQPVRNSSELTSQLVQSQKYREISLKNIQQWYSCFCWYMLYFYSQRWYIYICIPTLSKNFIPLACDLLNMVGISIPNRGLLAMPLCPYWGWCKTTCICQMGWFLRRVDIVGFSTLHPEIPMFFVLVT